jgi:hypothetical protein
MAMNSILYEMDRCLPAGYYCRQTKNYWPGATGFCSPAIMLCLIEKKNPVPVKPERDQLFCVRNQESEQENYIAASCTFCCNSITLSRNVLSVSIRSFTVWQEWITVV